MQQTAKPGTDGLHSVVRYDSVAVRLATKVPGTGSLATEEDLWQFF